MPPASIDGNELRELILSAFRGFHHGSDFANLKAQIAKLAAERGHPVRRPEVLHHDPDAAVLTELDRERIREMFWELVVHGVVIPGMNDNNPAWPWFRVTEHGRRILGESDATPHDPLGYVARLQQDAPGIDDTVLFYVNESVQCFVRATYTASAVMIGVASERLMLLLRDAISASMATDSVRRGKFDEATGAVGKRRAHISTVQERMMEYITSSASKLPPAVADSLDLALRSIFDAIRITRNESGHPTGTRIHRDVAHANLQVFPFYCGRVYRLIDWCGDNRWP